MNNYQQPDYRVPVSLATVQPHQQGAANGNPLRILAPILYYVEPGVTAKDDPSGNIRAGKSGKGSPG